ncbi:MAG: patatin-like phospholipase family protein [Clostridia bacterium]|nr:patatin-like phospholipase family protein [Clostridia bacterium]
MRRPKIGLVLGSGAFRGLAHIGVLQALEENRIPVDLLSGCSIGSLVGGAYCAGLTPAELEHLALNFADHQYYDLVPPRQGFLKGNKLQSLAQELTRDLSIEQMRIPFACVACDMNHGEQVVFREGPAHEAIRASVSIPGVFVPHEYRGMRLIDGCCMNSLPVDVVRRMGADIVIAVDVSYRGGPTHAVSIVETVLCAIDLAQWQHTQLALKETDVAIFPSLEGVSLINSSTAALAIENGRLAAQEVLPLIRETIDRWWDI